MHALLLDPGGVLNTRHIAFWTATFRRMKSVGFLPHERDYPHDHNYTYFGAQSHSLHSCFARLRTLLSKFARGRPYWPAGYALAKWNFRSAIRFIAQC